MAKKTADVISKSKFDAEVVSKMTENIQDRVDNIIELPMKGDKILLEEATMVEIGSGSYPAFTGKVVERNGKAVDLPITFWPSWIFNRYITEDGELLESSIDGENWRNFGSVEAVMGEIVSAPLLTINSITTKNCQVPVFENGVYKGRTIKQKSVYDLSFEEYED